VTRGRRVRRLAGGTAIAALSASAALAATQQTYSQKFTVKHPGRATGMTFKATATDPKEPIGHIPAQVRKVTLTFPPGTKIDTSAVTRCVKVDACPAASQIGSGTATVKFSNQHSTIPAKVYNRAGGLFLVFTTPFGTTVVLKPALKAGQLILTVPPLTLGTIKLTLSSMSLTIKKAGAASHPYARTPSSCPNSGKWTFKARFDYVNKTVKKLSSASPCTKH
jgi:hypothetical protein